MDLKYIRDNDIHEKYLLEQLSSAEKKAYEAFLKENPAALEEFEKTKSLVSGVRSAGSEFMRKEIAEQVREIKNPKTDWTILYRAAAVLFLFAILPAVVYYNVYVLDLPPQSEEQLMLDVIKDMQGSEYESELNEDSKIPAPEEMQISEKDKKSLSAKKMTQPASPVLSSSQKEMESTVEDALGSASGKDISSVLSSGAAGAGASKISDDLSGKNSAAEEEYQDHSLRTKPATNRVAVDEAFLKETEDKKLSNMQRASETVEMAPIAQSKKAKVIKKVINNKKLTINLVLLYQTPIADSLPFSIVIDSSSYTIELQIPARLFIIDEKEININWIEDKVQLSFKDEDVYQIILNSNEKYAKRIK